jgi:hypothetical protein
MKEPAIAPISPISLISPIAPISHDASMVSSVRSASRSARRLLGVAALGASLLGLVLLTACQQIPLEQQIAVKEPGSWDFRTDTAGGTEYIRIYDSPGKLGWFKYEYGQKSPCNQGFQKVIKTVAPGLVQYANDPDAKSFACNEKILYIFRTDANGQPYEGWVTGIKDREKKETPPLAYTVKYWESTGTKPKYFLIK